MRISIHASREFDRLFRTTARPVSLDLSAHVIVCRFGLGESVIVNGGYPGEVKARMETRTGVKYDVQYTVKGTPQRAWLGEGKLSPVKQGT